MGNQKQKLEGDSMQSIDPKRVAEQMMVFIKNAFNKERHANAVIGLSGGIDSATSCALAVRAVWSTYYPVLLPMENSMLKGTRCAISRLIG